MGRNNSVNVPRISAVKDTEKTKNEDCTKDVDHIGLIIETPDETGDEEVFLLNEPPTEI